MFKSLFKKNPALEAGRALYASAVEQARSEVLYVEMGVPDTMEGRFEMVSLHVYLLMRRLKAEDAAGTPAAKEVSQCLFDAMFQNMDDSLRELGVGDMVVGKRIRALAENFYGRLGAYESALSVDEPKQGLAKALGRNIFQDEDAPKSRALADYMLKAWHSIEAQPISRIANGVVAFAPAREAVQHD